MSRVDEALELGADLLTLCRQLERDLDLCRAVTTACCNNQAPRAEEKPTVPLSSITYAITLLEVEDKDGKALQYLRAVEEQHRPSSGPHGSQDV